MKQRLSVFLGIFLLVFSFSAATAQQGGDKYVFVISKVNYLKAISDAVSASKENGLNVQEIRVIFCGESVKAFQEQNPIVEKALAGDKVKLYACGLSLEQMKIDPKILPSKVSIVRNGILEAMVLEKQGYIKFDL